VSVKERATSQELYEYLTSGSHREIVERQSTSVTATTTTTTTTTTVKWLRNGRYELRNELRDMHTYKAYKCYDKQEGQEKFIKQIANIDMGFYREALKMKEEGLIANVRRYTDVFQEAKLSYIITPLEIVGQPFPLGLLF
jgi:hypothetical protein